jgi:hypothetical protein
MEDVVSVLAARGTRGIIATLWSRVAPPDGGRAGAEDPDIAQRTYAAIDIALTPWLRRSSFGASCRGVYGSMAVIGNDF